LGHRPGDATHDFYTDFYTKASEISLNYEVTLINGAMQELQVSLDEQLEQGAMQLWH
jgi:hypothetical protein